MLDEILETKRAEVARWKTREAQIALSCRAKAARPVRDLRAALAAPGVSLIAEVKRRSPSRGVLRRNFDPVMLARSYQAGGARAVSVLADRPFFGGGAEVVAAVASDTAMTLPVMFKEFVVDPIQVLQARSVGADAVLLIVRATTPGRLAELVAFAHEMGMEALVETFSPEEVEVALGAGARVVGVNNRDLGTFAVDPGRSERLLRALPAGVLSVSESGLTSRDDVRRAERLGYDGVLVGEALVIAPDPERRARELLGTLPEPGTPAGPATHGSALLSLEVFP